MPFLLSLNLPNAPENNKYLRDILALGIEREFSMKILQTVSVIFILMTLIMT